MSSLVAFLVSLGSKPKNNGEYEFDNCPWCGGKKTLRFNVDKVVGVCYKCPRTVTLEMLAKDVAGIPKSQLTTFVEDHAADERRKLGFEEAMLDGLLGESRPQGFVDLQPLEFPAEYRPFTLKPGSVIGRQALAYMRGRGFDPAVLVQSGFGYCPSGPYEGRVIIPFWENGELVYWQARDFTGRVDPKFKITNPPGDVWLKHGKSDVLFNHDGVKDLPAVVVTESWGSSLATGSAACGINGKHLSEVQLQKLVRMAATTFVILFDAGTLNESWKSAKLLTQHGKTALIASLNEGDPGEVSRPVLLRTVSRALPYSVENHVRAVAEATWGVGPDGPIKVD